MLCTTTTTTTTGVVCIPATPAAPRATGDHVGAKGGMQCKQMMMMTITDRKTLHANRLPTTTTTKTLDNNSTENVETAKHIFKA